MKMITNKIFLLFALCIAVIVSCKEEPSAEEVFLDKISKTWNAKSTSVDGVFVNGAFEKFSLTFAKNKTFTSINGNAPIWPVTGNFTLKPVSSSIGFSIIKSNGVEVIVSELSDKKLILKFQYVVGSGRISSVGGNYIFEFTH